jgi:hypothetical protein
LKTTSPAISPGRPNPIPLNALPSSNISFALYPL